MHQLLFFSLLALLPVQLGFHTWPSWSLVLGRRIDYLSPTLYLTDLLIFLLLLFWVIPSAVKAKKRRKIHRKTLGIIVASILLISVNIYVAGDRMVALFAWIKILEMTALGLYIVRTKPKISAILFPLSIGVFYSSVIAIMQFLLQRSIGGPLWFLGERTFSASTPGIARIDINASLFSFHYSLFKLRSYATFPHPNVLGGFLALTLPCIMVNQKKKVTIFAAATLVLGTIALALTFSRSAWLIFVLSILYVLFKKKKQLFLPAFFLAAISIFLIGNSIGFQDESVVVRQKLNAAAMSQLYESPLFGRGLGNFLVGLPDHLVSRTIYFLQPVHNIYLLLLSEVGVMGICFLSYLGFLYIKAQKKVRSGFQFSVIAILLLGLVDHYFLTLQQGQLLFTIFLSLSLIQ